MPEGPKLRSTHSLRSQIVALVVALVVPMLALQAWWSFNAYEGARERAWTDALAFADATSLSLRQFLAQSEELMIAHAAQSREGVVSGRDRCTEEMRGWCARFRSLRTRLRSPPMGKSSAPPKTPRPAHPGPNGLGSVTSAANLALWWGHP